MYLYFQILLSLNQDNIIIIDSKLKLKLSSFVLFLECLHERFKNVVWNSLEYWVKNRTNCFRIQMKKV